MKAIWNGKIIAESNEPKQVEGNEQFPPETVIRDYLKESSALTNCGWIGIALFSPGSGRENK